MFTKKIEFIIQLIKKIQNPIFFYAISAYENRNSAV